MHDTFLLNKISRSLEEICSQHGIKRIDRFTIVVNHDSHINQNNLCEHLKIHNREIIGNNIQVEIQREDIEAQTAIIHNIQGETFGE